VCARARVLRQINQQSDWILSGRQWIRSQKGKEFFFFTITTRSALWSTQPHIQFSGVKRSEREADDSSVSGAKVKNVWNFTSAIVILLDVMCTGTLLNTRAVLKVCELAAVRRCYAEGSGDCYSKL
jgi:hypothetical protein